MLILLQHVELCMTRLRRPGSRLAKGKWHECTTLALNSWTESSYVYIGDLTMLVTLINSDIVQLDWD